MMYSKLNEEMLLDGYVCITEGLDICSVVDGRKVYWNYCGYNGNGDYVCVTSRSRAFDIRFVYSDLVLDLDDSCCNHVSVTFIDEDYAAI